MKKFENVKSISVYNSAYDLLDSVDPAYFPCLVDDMTTFFEHFDDFEGLKYYLLNHETIIVTESGDVQGDPMTVEEFYQRIVDLYYEETGEEPADPYAVPLAPSEAACVWDD